jgi:hypothetical protein
MAVTKKEGKLTSKARRGRGSRALAFSAAGGASGLSPGATCLAAHNSAHNGCRTPALTPIVRKKSLSG